jgi:hypothetical protein
MTPEFAVTVRGRSTTLTKRSRGRTRIGRWGRGGSLPPFSFREKGRDEGFVIERNDANSTAHLSGELFKMLANVKMVRVPFKDAPGAVLALMSGEVELAFPNLPPDGVEAIGGTPEEFTAVMKTGIAKWTAVSKTSGAKAD